METEVKDKVEEAELETLEKEADQPEVEKPQPKAKAKESPKEAKLGYFENAKVVCACGTTFTVGSTKPEIRVEVCSNCHPFFTGQAKFVDTEGRVEAFRRREGAKVEKKEKKQSEPSKPERPKSLKEMLEVLQSS